MDKRFWGIIIAIFVIFAGIVFINQDKNAGDTSKVTNHVMGKNGKNITLIEYGDYQCPACGAFHPVVKQIVEKYKNDIAFQFRNLPLTKIHPNAFAAARAAEAAGKQGKFWEMHDMLYEQQTTWSQAKDAKSYFEDYASQLDLDVNAFNKDFTSQAVNSAINADIAAFKKTGAATQTPSFFLNGKQLDIKNADFSAFEKAIDTGINKAN